MTDLRKIDEFIDLVEKKWTYDKNDFTYFEDWLSNRQTGAASEVLLLTPKQKKGLLKQVNDLIEKYEAFPNKYPPSEVYDFKDGCVIIGAAYTPGPIFKRLLGFVNNGLRVKIKGGTVININHEIHLKVDFLLKFRFIIENGRKKHTLLHQESENKTDNHKTEIKPIFKPEDVQTVFDLLKNYFNAEHQSQLYQMLRTGNDATGSLIFLDNGNRLADSFKQLIDADIITGCQKKELESWIFRNFKYRNNQKIKEFTPRYLNDLISTTNDFCRNPILNVSRDRATGNILIKRA